MVPRLSLLVGESADWVLQLMIILAIASHGVHYMFGRAEAGLRSERWAWHAKRLAWSCDVPTAVRP